MKKVIEVKNENGFTDGSITLDIEPGSKKYIYISEKKVIFARKGDYHIDLVKKFHEEYKLLPRDFEISGGHVKGGVKIKLFGKSEQYGAPSRILLFFLRKAFEKESRIEIEIEPLKMEKLEIPWHARELKEKCPECGEFLFGFESSYKYSRACKKCNYSDGGRKYDRLRE